MVKASRLPVFSARNILSATVIVQAGIAADATSPNQK
jgi:hypothetical protein